jgi:hypothetical protein
VPTVLTAPPAPSPSADPVGFFESVYRAVADHDYKVAAALALVALVWAARTFGASKIPWLKTDRGGVALALGVSLAGAMASALMAHAKLTAHTFLVALQVGVLAAGGWTMVKRLLWPKDSPAAPPMPMPLPLPPRASPPPKLAR